MSATYARVRSTCLATLSESGSLKRDEISKRVGVALGVNGLARQSETSLTDRDMTFFKAIGEALDELRRHGAVETVKEEKLTWVRMTKDGRELFDEHPTVPETALVELGKRTAATLTAAQYLNESIAKRRQELSDHLDAVLDATVSMGRQRLQTKLVPDMLRRLGYVSTKPELYWQSAEDQASGAIPWAVTYQDRFGFTTMVRVVCPTSQLTHMDDMSDFGQHMSGVGATRGLYFTTTTFESSVSEYYRNPKHKKRQIAVFDGYELAGLLSSAGMVTEDGTNVVEPPSIPNDEVLMATLLWELLGSDFKDVGSLSTAVAKEFDIIGEDPRLRTGALYKKVALTVDTLAAAGLVMSDGSTASSGWMISLMGRELLEECPEEVSYQQITELIRNPR